MANTSVKEKFICNIKNGILGDVFFKILANIVQTIFRNIIVLPMLANYFSNNQYGELVTIVGVIATIASALGNALLSTRLVMEMDYKRKQIEGDFNPLCLLASGLSLLGTPFIASLFPGQSMLNIFLIACVLFLETFTGYQSGWFILKQAYRKLLIYTIVGGVGFGFGLILTKITGSWPLTFLCSDIINFGFIYFLSPLTKEKIQFTENIKVTLRKYAILILTTAIGNALTYMDRLLLYPTIGSEAVAIYTTASTFGKAFSIIALPISSIMLGYYATEKIKLDRRKFWYINGGMLGALFVFIIITRLIGIWITGILYPKLILQAEPYVLIANLSSAIGATAQITKSAALKYAKTYWTLIIQAVYGIVYIGLGTLMARNSGLDGFSIAVLIANIVQIFLLYIVCHMSLGNKEVEEYANK